MLYQYHMGVHNTELNKFETLESRRCGVADPQNTPPHVLPCQIWSFWVKPYYMEVRRKGRVTSHPAFQGHSRSLKDQDQSFKSTSLLLSCDP